MFDVLLKRERELLRNVIQNASKPTLKVSMVSNIRVATTGGQRDRILNRRNIGAMILQSKHQTLRVYKKISKYLAKLLSKYP
jgi:hypothetical protein